MLLWEFISGSACWTTWIKLRIRDLSGPSPLVKIFKLLVIVFCSLFVLFFLFFLDYDLIPICLLLHLEAGIDLETFIASTFGYKPSSNTDTNIRKNSNKDQVDVTFTFQWKWKIPSAAPSAFVRLRLSLC